MSTGKKLYIQEVAPRDGFQNERRFIDTEDKIDFIDTLSQNGFAKIEVTSFTSPKAIPALRDAETVMQRITRHPDVIYTALVPNVRGAQRALACRVDEVNLVMSVSETHNQTNLRMSREQSLAQLTDVIKVVHDSASGVALSLDETATVRIRLNHSAVTSQQIRDALITFTTPYFIDSVPLA